MTVTARAPAKVNVQLAVGPLRPDGFHELTTVYLAVSLFDTVTVRPADGLAVSVTGVDADVVPTDRRNLVWRAAGILLAISISASARTPACSASSSAARQTRLRRSVGTTSASSPDTETLSPSSARTLTVSNSDTAR